MRLSWVGTEMILLGLLSEKDEIAAKVLVQSGLIPAEVRAAVESIVGHGMTQTPVELPFTPTAIKVLDYSSEEAKDSYFGAVESEHILLGLIREAQEITLNEKLGVAARVLQDRRIDLASLRSVLVNTIHSSSPVLRLKTRIQNLHACAKAHYGNYKNPLADLGYHINSKDPFDQMVLPMVANEELNLSRRALRKKFEYACKLAEFEGTTVPTRPEDPEELFGDES